MLTYWLFNWAYIYIYISLCICDWQTIMLSWIPRPNKGKRKDCVLSSWYDTWCREELGGCSGWWCWDDPRWSICREFKHASRFLCSYFNCLSNWWSFRFILHLQHKVIKFSVLIDWFRSFKSCSKSVFYITNMFLSFQVTGSIYKWLYWNWKSGCASHGFLFINWTKWNYTRDPQGTLQDSFLFYDWLFWFKKNKDELLLDFETINSSAVFITSKFC